MRWDEKERTPEMFNRIAGKYDRMNAILSFGRHRAWRRKMASLLPEKAERILDLAIGTGDQLMENLKGREVIYAAGLDPAKEMLAIANKKFARFSHPANIDLLLGHAEELPFADREFDAITISFGIRNTKDPLAALREMRRVLKPDGIVLVMEFAMPIFPLIRFISLFHLRYIVPMTGKILGKDLEAYHYLSDSIRAFPSGKAFCALMQRAEFSSCEITTLFFGNVLIYRGKR